MARRLTDEDYARLLAFRSELRSFLRWSEEQAQELGLTPALHQLLLVIRGRPDATIADAAAELQVRHHSVVELAQRGETAGLLTRERDPHDHRCVQLRLTPEGREQLELLTRRHLMPIERLAATLSEAVHPGDDTP